MCPRDDTQKEQRQQVFNITLAAVAGQVGCLTFVIIILALLGGLWLDNQFNTDNHMFTLILVIGSIPVSLVVMAFVAWTAVGKMKLQLDEKKEEKPEEEVNLGRDENP